MRSSIRRQRAADQLAAQTPKPPRETVRVRADGRLTWDLATPVRPVVDTEPSRAFDAL